MVSYLGAFPFQNTLAPSVLTFEAMVKVVVLLTERYGKVLRRARSDRVKLLFGSLADVGRRDFGLQEGKEDADKNQDEGKGESEREHSHATGFAIDEPVNDEDEDEDDDDLALAALESLDAIEVFKHDRRIDKTVYEARISADTFRRLLMLLLVISPLKPLESVKKYTTDLTPERMESVRIEADSILAAFMPEDGTGGISYQTFARIVSSSLPYLFDPLTPLFEHLLFSKHLDLSQKRARAESTSTTEPEEKMPKTPETTPSPIMLPGSFESSILNPSTISHLSFFLPSTSSVNFIRSGIKLHPVFSTSAHGSSLTSFSHHVLTWQSSTLLILQGTVTDSTSQDQQSMITLGAYLPHPWKSSSSHHSTSSKPRDSNALPCLFHLSPKHTLLKGNPSSSVYTQNTPEAYFSNNTGIAIGAKIPPSSRSQTLTPTPHGAGSLLIDSSLDYATFHISSVGHNGVFLPPVTPLPSTTTSTTTPTSPSLSSSFISSKSTSDTSTKTTIDIYNLEIWGLVPDETSDGPSAMEQQRAKWDFEAREAERRRNINFKAGGDSSMESARWLLESAGLIGGNKSGGSV